MKTMTHGVKSFGKVNNDKDLPRAQLGIVKPIQNRLRKIKNLIKEQEAEREEGQRRRQEKSDLRNCNEEK